MARRFRSRTTTRKRTGRNVWINENLNQTPANNSLGTVDLLTSAGDFMKFDTTIQRVIVPAFSTSQTTSAVAGMREWRFALIVAHEGMDPLDFEVLFGDSIGPAWMYMWGRSVRTSAAAELTIDFTASGMQGGPIDAKAKRRFRENNATLWLIHQNFADAGDTNLSINGMVRTLIHIP